MTLNKQRETKCVPWMVRLAALMLATLPFGAKLAVAHPHLFVEDKVIVNFDASHRMTGVTQHWTFDDYYSEQALEGMDSNGDGKFDTSELAVLAKDNMQSLKEYAYFTFVTVDGAKVDFDAPTDAVVARDDKKILHLTFTLPLKATLDVVVKPVSFQVFDAEFYIGITFPKQNPIKFDGAPTGCAPTIEAPSNDIAKARSWGGANAATVYITCKP